MERYLNDLDLLRIKTPDDTDEACDLELDITQANRVLDKLDE